MNEDPQEVSGFEVTPGMEWVEDLIRSGFGGGYIPAAPPVVAVYEPETIDWEAEHRLSHKTLLDGVEALERAHGRFPECIGLGTIATARKQARDYKRIHNL